MKVELYNYIKAAQKMNRRQILKGTAALGAVAMMPKGAMADGHENVRAEILKIPGVGAGSPTDSDWQKVGELCLGATKGNV
ncbi:MAG: twin-arginine translocation signal domain-containing protein, partial [Roseibium sp.]